jgi:hypothetical protein
MSAGPTAKSGRDIIAFFAGHLANLVNGNDSLAEVEDIVVIKPFQLYERIRRLLISSRRYSDGLLGVWAYPPPDGVEEASDFYFDYVLNRPIAARRGEPTSADNLAALVASRGVGPRAAAPADAALSTWKALVGGPSRLRRFKEKNCLTGSSNAWMRRTGPTPKCCASDFARRNGWSAMLLSASIRLRPPIPSSRR